MDSSLIYYTLLVLLDFGFGRPEDCFNRTVGLRDASGIPYYYFQASSYSEETFGKKLNKVGGSAWCPASDKKYDSYLEVDLGSKYSLCGVSTKGDSKGHATKYKLLMSSDRIEWIAYSENNNVKIFSGNNDSSSLVKHKFTSAQTARFVRFYPTESTSLPCMVVELYGTEIGKETCEKTNLKITKITSSNKAVNINESRPWCPDKNADNQYLEIDIGAYGVVCAVKAVDNSSASMMKAKSYQLQFSMDGKEWSTYKENNMTKKYFSNEEHLLSKRILCRYMRFTTLKNIECIWVELFGYSHEVLLIEDIGLKYENRLLKEKFPNESFPSIRDTFEADHEPKNGRLYMPGSWCSRPKSIVYIEIVLAEKYYIFAVSVQGFRPSHSDVLFTKKYRITHSTNYQNWSYSTDDGKEWINTSSTNVVSVHPLREPIEARIVRLETEPFVQSCLKVELHGISAIISGGCASFYPLGLSAKKIPDTDLTASSKYSYFYPASNARLRNVKAWFAQENDKNAYITVDLGKIVLISGVATQGFNQEGIDKNSGRVTHYKVRYSYDNQAWLNYTHPNNFDKIFDGNIISDYDAIFANWFDPPVVARFFRLIAVDYFNQVRLRMELYGCKEVSGAPAVNIKFSRKTLNRTENDAVKLTCIVQGQPGMNISWTREGKIIGTSTFENSSTVYPSHLGISGTAVSNLTVTYHIDKEIFEYFNCSKSEENFRELHCRSIYQCSASYPGGKATTKSVIINVSPNIILPAVPKQLRVVIVKSRTAVLSWRAAEDYEESRLTAYVIHLSKVSDNTTSERNITLGLKNSSLEIMLPNLSEYTQYSVKVAAANSLTLSSFSRTENFITLLPANVSLSDHDFIKVKENQSNVSIVCTGISYPTPNITWKKNGEELTRVESKAAANDSIVYQLVKTFEKDQKSNVAIKVTSTLFLRPAGINFKDRGYYSCEVLNKNESNTPANETIGVFFPPRILERPQSRTYHEGGKISLTCRAEALPQANVTWDILKDMVDMRETDYRNGTLVIEGLKSLGEYQFMVICKAESKGGKATANASIQILVKPRITDLTKDLTAILYDNVTLKCSILANPPPHVTWTKNDAVIDERNVHLQDDNKTIFIERARLKNIGKYSCKAQNNLSSASKSLILSLKALPKVHVIGSLTRKLRIGEKNVTVNCLGYGYPKPNITWKINGTGIVFWNNSMANHVYQQVYEDGVDPKNVTNLQYDNNLEYVKSVLHIRPFGADFYDYGNYTCEVKIGSDINNKSVEVIFFPVIKSGKGPESMTILEGHDALLNCMVDGQPPPSTFWLFQNKDISTNHTVFPNGSLKLDSVQNTAKYEGLYSCFAKNKAGESRKSNATLTVHVPAKIVTLTPSGVYQLKDNVTLNCLVAGDPFPRVIWTKVNESGLSTLPKFILGDKNQTLTITNVTLKDHGNYTCTTSNKYQTVKNHVIVYVEVKPNVTLNSSSTLFLKTVQESAIITCSVIAYPSLNVTWYRNGQEVGKGNDSSEIDVYQKVVNSRPDYFLQPVASILYVNPNNTKSQFGNYTCRAAPNVSKRVEIVLIPNVTISPTSLTVLQGQNISFHCSADGAPTPLISWSKLKGSSPLNVTKKLANNVLVLKKVTNDDEGTYICTATNRGNPINVNVTLTVHVKPRIKSELEDDDVRNGTSYQLNCSATGDPDPTYKWTRNGKPNVPNSATTLNSSLLKIDPVTIENEGIYTCTVQNIQGNASSTAKITVYEPPKIITPPRNATHKETENVTFICEGTGIPTPTFTWRKNKHNVSRGIKKDTKIRNLQRSTWFIDNVKFTDRGWYSCELKNRKRNVSRFAVLTVNVPPIANITPTTNYVEKGKPINITCVVYGFPNPVVIWKKNERNITLNGHYFNHTIDADREELTRKNQLQIRRALRNDNGNYSCFVKNIAGENESTVLLIVLESPDPLNFTITNVTRRSVVLRWRVVFDGNSVIQKITLKYFENGSKPESGMTKNFTSNITSFTVKSLTPGKWYVFEITATNKIGTSNISFGEVMIKEDVPSHPRNVTLKPLSATTIQVNWSRPAHENGKIIYYRVYYRKAIEDEENFHNVSGDVYYYDIHFLNPFTNYTIEVQGYTSAGGGNRSLPKVSRTFESVPSKPVNFRVEYISNTSVNLKWSTPRRKNGIIKRYEICYYSHGNKNDTQMYNVPGNRNSAEIGLKPYTFYTFWIQAVTLAGVGNSSERVENRTKEGVPSEPLNVKSTVLGNTSITVSWSPPKYKNGILRHYVIYYQDILKQGILSMEIRDNSTNATLYSLNPFTNYTLEIQAHTSAGGGNWSKAITNMTDEGVPSEPRNIELVASTNTSLTISWEEPEHLNGILKMYIIYYKKISENHERGDETNYKRKAPQRNTEWKIKSLSVYSSYIFFVQAYTSAGPGNWSMRFLAATKPGENVRGVDRKTMIPVALPYITSHKGIIRFYRIIVILSDENGRQANDSNSYREFKSYDEIQEMKKEERMGVPYVAFAFKGEDFEIYQCFVLGAGQTFSNKFSERKRNADQYRNGPLDPGSSYKLFVRGYTAEDDYVSSKSLPVFTFQEERKISRQGKFDYVVTIVVVVVVVIVLALFITAIWFRVKKRKKDVPSAQGMVNLGHPIPLAELRSYVESTDFSDEFQTIPKITRRAITIASTPINQPKNRYQNILPYDYSRVSLSMKEGEQDCDYINASYIRGFRKPERYIATQGPLPTTANDFWRMVWEQECSVIVMLTGLNENGKIKCFQYWPVTPDGKTYDNIAVNQIGEAVFADYTARYFNLKEISSGKTRKLQHLHFTAWPDHGVPRYPGPLLHFHNRFRAALTGSQPAIVHCSAGCGRTGTFIALDYILQKLQEERESDLMVDVQHFVREMRGQRVLMVQTQQQYEFIHTAILEAATFSHTEISAADIRVKAAILREKIPGSGKTKAKEEFQKLKQRSITETCEHALSVDNERKNRSQVIPYDYNRVHLGEMANQTDYINASFISGYQHSKNFIATQYPMSNTVSDFWRMILEQKCGVIVCISTKAEQYEFGIYCPDEGFSSYGPITVAFEGINKDFIASGIVVRKFKLTDTRDTKGCPLVVTHFHFLGWPRNGLPDAPSMLQLLAEVERAQRFSGNTLVTVHCSDGSGRTGSFCAIVSAIERVKLENSLDLVMTVRNLQAQRPEMVENETQYQFCYDAVAAFMDSFDDQLYGNFKSQSVDLDISNTSVDKGKHLVTKF